MWGAAFRSQRAPSSSIVILSCSSWPGSRTAPRAMPSAPRPRAGGTRRSPSRGRAGRARSRGAANSNSSDVTALTGRVDYVPRPVFPGVTRVRCVQCGVGGRAAVASYRAGRWARGRVGAGRYYRACPNRRIPTDRRHVDRGRVGRTGDRGQRPATPKTPRRTYGCGPGLIESGYEHCRIAIGTGARS